MAKKKRKKTSSRRRRSGNNTALAGKLQNMQALAGAVTLYGPSILEKMPHAYDNEAEGLGKKVTTNKRVLIIVALIIWCITRRELKYKLWSIPLTALLTVAVQQHRLTYQADDEDTTEIQESYE